MCLFFCVFVPSPTDGHPWIGLLPPFAPCAFSRVPASLGTAEGEEDCQTSEGHKRAKSGSVGTKSMSEAEIASYRKGKYVEKQEASAQEALKAAFSWLNSNGKIGYHCTVCLGSLVKCGDKLSTTGYGVEANGELTPVPSHQKLRVHENKDQHKYNVKKVQQAKATGQSSSAGGSMKPLLTITSEEDLCAPPYPPCTASPHPHHTHHPAHPLPRSPAPPLTTLALAQMHARSARSTSSPSASSRSPPCTACLSCRTPTGW